MMCFIAGLITGTLATIGITLLLIVAGVQKEDE